MKQAASEKALAACLADEQECITFVRVVKSKTACYQRRPQAGPPPKPRPPQGE